MEFDDVSPKNKSLSRHCEEAEGDAAIQTYKSKDTHRPYNIGKLLLQENYALDLHPGASPERKGMLN